MRNSAQKKFAIFLLLILFLKAYPQNNTIDSLEKVLQMQKEDTGKVNTLNAISYNYRNTQPDSGLHYGEQALVLAPTCYLLPATCYLLLFIQTSLP